MTQAKNGDTVKVHYTGKLEDGRVFDSSENRDPLQVEIGKGNVIPGFENAIVGMEEGETKSVSVPKEEAYGSRRDELVIKVQKNALPENVTPTVGQRLNVQQPNGRVVPVVVTEMDEGSITIDANHPLADETLHFDIRLVSVG